MSTNPTKAENFSVIKFFAQFEQAVQACNVYPITPDNLAVQQDAYKRLADNLDEVSDNAFEIFAELEYGKKGKDSDLRFSVQFTPTVFIVHIETASEPLPFAYGTVFESEAVAVEQLMALLCMLANGQFVSLMTERNGTVCAVELMVQNRSSRSYKSLLTDGHYPKRWKKDDEDGYEVSVLRNTHMTEKVAIPKNFFLQDNDADGNLFIKGRVLKNGLDVPLTKKLYDQMMLDLSMHLAGRKKDEVDKEWKLLVRSWEVWLLGIIVTVLVILGYTQKILPAFIRDLPVAVVSWPLFFIFCYAAYFIVGHKGYYRYMYPDHPWIRFDNALGRGFAAIGLRRKRGQTSHTFDRKNMSEGGGPAASSPVAAGKPTKVERLKKIVLYLTPAAIIMSALLIAVAGYWLGQSLPAASLMHVRPEHMAWCYYGIAGLAFAVAVAFATKRISTKWLRWLTVALFVVAFAPILFFVKDNSEQGSGWPWLLLTVGNLLHFLTGVAAAKAASKDEQVITDEDSHEDYEAVIITIKLSDDGFGTEAERDAVYELEDAIEELETPIYIDVDGHDFGDGEASIYLYGEDADAILEAVQPVLKRTKFKSMSALLRYGPPDDEDTIEKVETIY